MKDFDLVVIGAGPGGYVSAIRAAQLGKKVAVIEKNKIGGTCLHVGCIPSKTLLHAASSIDRMKTAKNWGISTNNIQFDVKQFMRKKDSIVDSLTKGIQGLFAKNDITFFHGEARVKPNLIVEVNQERLRAKKLILATGSRPFIPDIKGLEEVNFDTTDSFFYKKSLPKHLAIIGGGVIAIELATALQALGTRVTVVEVAEDILLSEDEEARKLVKKQLEVNQVEIITKARIKEVKEGVIILEDRKVYFDDLLVATGRKPVTDLAKSLNLEMDPSGRFVEVNEGFETSKRNIYAIGDLIGGYQLAHAAMAEGIAVAHAIAEGKPKEVSPLDVTRCVYTFPEIASVGMSENEAKALDKDIVVTHFPIQANGMALLSDDHHGFVKIIADRKYGEIKGAVVVGNQATELISSILGVKYSEGTVDELASMIWPHPTVSEMIGESANDMYGLAIHK